MWKKTVSCRITPAYAGKSLYDTRVALKKADHPRLCGEKSPYLAQAPITEGSPPPMRGKVYAAVSVPDTVGITPAYAGKSH